MADITVLLAAIMAAKKGEEVRGSIHDAIEQCYQDGRAGVNDLQARQLIETVSAVNEEQQAALEVLQARVEELESGEGGSSQQSTTIDIPTVLVDGGVVESLNVNNNGTTTHHITFTTEFTEAPKVMVAIGKNAGAVSQYGYLSANILYPTITTTGFDFFLANRTGSDRSPGVVWYAYQPTVETIDLDITIPDAQGMTESQVRAITGPISAAVDAIKTGYDGTVYQTAAEAVRTQINDLHVLIGDEPGTAIDSDSIGYGEGSVEDALDELNERLDDNLFAVTTASWEQGGIVLATGWPEDNSKRCRIEKFFLKKGATFTITPNGFWYNFAKYKALDGSYQAFKTSWTSDNTEATYTVDYDAYVVVWVRNADNTGVIPSDVLTVVTYQKDLLVDVIDKADVLESSLPKEKTKIEIYPSANGLTFSGNLASNDPLLVTVNNIFYFRNTDNQSGVGYLNRQGGTYSIGSGCGLFFDITARQLEIIDTGYFVPSNKLLLLGKEGTIINGLWSVYYYHKSQYVNANGQTVWVVGNGYIPTIQGACDLASDGDIIFVRCGTYTEQVSIWTRKLHIVGEDKVNTILIDHSGNYDTPPLEMAMGSLSNMTIVEDGSSPTVEPSDGRYMMAYCLHIEHPNAAGETFVIDNCDFINDVHVPLGCGMRANNTVHFRNCTFRCNAENEGSSAERGGFFVHAQNKDNIENQNVILENCIISSAGPRLAAMFGVPANANNTGSMYIRMSNCCVWNENRGIADNAVGWDTSGGTDVMSIVHSYGNTISMLNSTS